MRIVMMVGGMATLNVVIDTGAAASLSVSASSLEKIQHCQSRSSQGLCNEG